MTTVSGHAKKPDGSPLDGSHCVVRFDLAFTGPNVARIPGTTAIAQTYFEVEPDSDDGSFSVDLYGNDLISCNGVIGNTRWRVTYVVDNVSGPAKLYDITGNAFSLDEAEPIDGVPVVVAPSLPPFAIVINFPTTQTDPSEEIFRMQIGKVANILTFPSNFIGSGFSVNPANLSTHGTTFIVNRIRGGVTDQVGSVTVEAGLDSAIYATIDGDQFLYQPDDEFQVVGPISPDPTLAHFTFTFVAGRS